MMKAMNVLMNSVIFREYDIRGVVDTDFGGDFAFALGQAHIRYIQKHRGETAPVVTVGHDARLSSPTLASRVVAGMVSAGAHVIELGLITTPISYFSTFTIKDVAGAIMITGSHNPPEYNGFKISVGPSTIFGAAIQELREIIERRDFPIGQGSRKTFDIFPSYLERYSKEFGQLRNIPVVIDCGNGAAGCIARRLLEAVGLRCTILFEQPDGLFPNHHPDPTVLENLTELIAAVKKEGARVGIGFDGDCDRIGVVDHTGKMIYGDELMAIVCRDILPQNPGATIIGDVKCSDRLYADVARHGGKPIMWKTGHSLVKQKIKDEHAPFGGELSGHVFFADRNYGYDDALYAAIRLIEILAKSDKTMDELLAGFGDAHNTPEIRIDTTEEKKHTIVTGLKKIYAEKPGPYKVNLTDGIRVSFADGWALARASNTQPVIVMRFESSTPQGLRRIQSEFEGHVKQWL